MVVEDISTIICFVFREKGGGIFEGGSYLMGGGATAKCSSLSFSQPRISSACCVSYEETDLEAS